MLLSELIARAQEELATHGDVIVEFSYTGSPDEPVRFIKGGSYSPLMLIIPQSYEHYYGDDL